MNFKVGDKVKCINDFQSNGLLTKGKIYTISAISRSMIGLEEKNDDESRWDKDRFKLTKNGKPFKANFLLKYDLDEDPIEEYETMQQVNDRIKHLVENERSLKKESIVIYEIKSKHSVSISTRITKKLIK